MGASGARRRPWGEEQRELWGGVPSIRAARVGEEKQREAALRGTPVSYGPKEERVPVQQPAGEGTGVCPHRSRGHSASERG